MEHERLTQRNSIGGAYYPYCMQEATCYGVGASVKCNSCEFNNEVLEKLATYEDLEEQGLLLRLPVSEGTQVHCIGSCGELCDDYSADCEVCGEHKVVFTTSFDRNMIEQFGKTVFLTNEEAEQALKQMGE